MRLTLRKHGKQLKGVAEDERNYRIIFRFICLCSLYIYINICYFCSSRGYCEGYSIMSKVKDYGLLGQWSVDTLWAQCKTAEKVDEDVVRAMIRYFDFHVVLDVDIPLSTLFSLPESVEEIYNNECEDVDTSEFDKLVGNCMVMSYGKLSKAVIGLIDKNALFIKKQKATNAHYDNMVNDLKKHAQELYNEA